MWEGMDFGGELVYFGNKAYFLSQVFTKRGQCTFFVRIKMRNLYTRTMKTGHFVDN